MLIVFIHLPAFVFRIMVMESGRVKELDAPEALLLNKQSLFYSLAKDAKLVS